MSINPDNIYRQCNYLYEKGNKLIKTSNFILFFWRSYEYFMELNEYCKSHEEMKRYLDSDIFNNQMIIDRVKRLPTIEFKNYSSYRSDWKYGIILIFMYIFFPFFYIWHINGIRYLNDTKNKIHIANGIYGSISFLLKGK